MLTFRDDDEVIYSLVMIERRSYLMATTASSANTVIGVKELYNSLKKRAARITSPTWDIDLMVRTREGIASPHSLNIITLFWYHIYLTDRAMYDRLKSTSDETTMRQMLCGRVQTAYIMGEKTINTTSDLYSVQFQEIINAYIDYTDELTAASATSH